MKNKSVKRINWFVLVVFLFTLFNPGSLNKIKVEAANNITGTDYAVLTGNLMKENNLGDDWDPANMSGKLKEYKNGIYEETFKLMKNKDYEYKIAMNGTWDESFGKDGGQDNVVLKTGDHDKVTFRLDLINKKVYDSINNPDEFKEKAIFTGSLAKCFGGKDWDPSDDNFKMDYIGGGMYQKTFAVKSSGKVEYKAAYNGDWNNGEAAANNSFEILTGTKDVAIFADYIGNVTEDSVSNSEITKTVSILGNFKDGKKDLTYDMYKIDGSKLMYSEVLQPGTYEYKGVINNNVNDGVLPKEGTKKVTVSTAQNVVFVADTKANEIIDSVSDLAKVKEALGIVKKAEPLNSPVINDNGTITFNYKNDNASSVYLSSSLNGFSKNGDELKKNDEGVWSVTVRPGDQAQEIQYKFIVDGNEELDKLNSNSKDGNSVVNFAGFKGRPVTLPGSLETGIDGTDGSWNPADKAMKLDYIGNGNYKHTFKVKAGRYEYKAAINYTWDPENYGLNGVNHGNNIALVVPKDMDITFYYNDDSHNVVTSLDYKILKVALYNGDSEVCNLTDDMLNGIYKGKADLTKGTYNNLSLKIKGDEEKTVKVDAFTLNNDKTVTFSYDPESELCFNDASDNKINAAGLYYDSRSEEYKNPYGAVSEGTEITLNLKADKDMLTEAKFILGTPDGTKVLDMSKNGSFSDGSDKWQVKYTPEAIGTYSYYFVVSNGSDVKAYGDDDGYFGTGIAGNLGEVKNYEFNVSVKDFKTPDWLKNGVLYQIYPDRFFNGDKTNDFDQKYARGNTPYEFPTDWYSLPKDPQLYEEEDYPEKANRGSSSWSTDIYGGDLKGVEDKVKYLKALGVTVLYLNPIGQSISSHRYDTTDYKNIDPQLGNMDDFVSLAKAAKDNEMHIILDGVYNHVSDDSIYFDKYAKYVCKDKPLGAYQYWSHVYDEMNNNGLSLSEAETKTQDYYKELGISDFHYKDWFIVKNEKYEAEEGGEYYSYEGWSGYDSMPVIQALNGSEYNVKSWADEIIDGNDSAARLWLKKGSNGWRLDVANEVSDETWRAFRKAVKSEGDNAIIGEIWTDASNYILGDMYDSVMNYRFRGAVLNYAKGTQDDNVTKVTAKDSMNELEKMREQYPLEALEAMMNLMGSHDTQRAISALDGYQKGVRGFAKDPSETAFAKMRLIPFLQMTYIGAPTIYYGDEIGMSGCDDPDNRRAFTWGKGNKSLVEWYSLLAKIRSQYQALRTGDVKPADVQKEFADDVMAYTRIDDDAKVLAACNRQEKTVKVVIKTPGISEGTKLTNLLNKEEVYTVKDGCVSVSIPACSGVILADKVKDITVDYEDLKDAYSEDAKVINRAVPKTDAELIEEIKNAKEGDSIVISENDDAVSLNLLREAETLGKKLKYVIKREDGKVSIIISDVTKFRKVLEEQGLTNLLIKTNNELKNNDKITEIKPLEKFNISSNLAENELGSAVEVQVQLDKSLNNKEMFNYFIDKDGKMKLVSKDVVANNMITFNTDKLGDFFIADEEIKEEEDNKGTPGQGTPGQGTSGQGTPEQETPGQGTPGQGTPSDDEIVNSANNKDKDKSHIGSAKTGDNSIIIMSILLLSFLACVKSRKKQIN